MRPYYLCVPSKTDRGPLRPVDLQLAGFPCMTDPKDRSAGDLEEGSCSLCFSTFEPETTFRQLPCQHIFHQPCIDEWLCKHDASCPLCRETFYHLRQPYIIEEPFEQRSTPPRSQEDIEAELREARQLFVKWWRDFFSLSWLRHGTMITERKRDQSQQGPYPH